MKTQFWIGAALTLAVSAWCLYLLIPAREWVHVGSVAIIPVLVVAQTARLAKRGDRFAGPLMWIGLLVVMSYLSFSSTVAALGHG